MPTTTTRSTMLELLFLNVLLSLSFSFSLSLNQEGLFLLKAKLQLSDPSNSLSHWNPADTTPCNWPGVTCHPISAAATSLHLDNPLLSGPSPPSLCRLPSLSSLSL